MIDVKDLDKQEKDLNKQYQQLQAQSTEVNAQLFRVEGAILQIQQLKANFANPVMEDESGPKPVDDRPPDDPKKKR
jgi:prefoldin subunit 5